MDNLSKQTLLPSEVLIVDGAPQGEYETEQVVTGAQARGGFRCIYIRQQGGTAIQRNAGIDLASGDFIAFIDDDVRLEPGFLQQIVEIFQQDGSERVGGVLGFRENEQFTLEERRRWRWYKRLGLLKTFEAGRYDYETGYPINIRMHRPFSGTRDVDFISSACAVWRREVFDSGLRFDPFFTDYGVLEDAHMSLRAARNWKLLLCGHARCTHLASPRSRVDRRKLGYKLVVNYYFVFKSIAGTLTLRQKTRFWLFQTFELLRIASSAIRRRRSGDLEEVLGRLEGVLACLRGTAIPSAS